MKLFVGLGNPGKEYEGTRHNVGFVVLDRLVEQIKSSILKVQSYNPKFKLNEKFQADFIQIDDVTLVKPQTFMNRSGEAVGKLVRFYKIALTDLWVVHDDLDIALGKYKIQFGKGPKQHYGLQSIYEKLGTKEFWHVRIGIENRSQETQNSKLKTQSVNQREDLQKEKLSDRVRISGEEYVLQRFTDAELLVLQPVLTRVVGELLSLAR